MNTLTVDTIAGISSTLIRAFSGEEILIETHNYNNHFLNGDSAALIKYNITTKQSEFIDYISSSYARTSRIVDNHILVTNPTFTSGTCSLINLRDNSKIFVTVQLD